MRRIERRLQRRVQFPDPQAPAVHRRQHLDIADRVQPEPPRNFLPHETNHQLGDFFRFLPGQEGKVCVLFPRLLRHPPVPDIMRGPHNAARFGLAENLRQAHRGHGAAGQQVGQNGPRAHAGQLVRIADQDKGTVGRKGTAQGRHQRDVDHGKFVDHHEVRIERVALPALESAGRQYFKQPVDGLGRTPRRFTHPLGRASGRRAEEEPHPLGRENLQQAVEQGGLAHARTSGDHDYARAKHLPQRVHLARRKRLAGFLLHPAERFFEFDLRILRRLGGQSSHRLGNRLLRRAQGRQENHGVAGDFLDGQMPVRHLPVEGTNHDAFINAKQLPGRREQCRPRQRGVPFSRGLGQHVLQPAPGPQDGIMTESEFCADRVRRFKSDARDIPRQQVRIGPYAHDGFLPVELKDPERTTRADPVAVQENHNVPHDPLLGPSRLDLLPPPRSDSLHIFQARRGIFDDLENFLPEFRHHLFRVNRSDPADQSAAEIFFNALEGGRGVATDIRRAQLHSVVATPLPPPLRRDPFAGRDRRDHTDHRHQVAPAFHFHLEHREAGVLIVEGDSLDQAG